MEADGVTSWNSVLEKKCSDVKTSKVSLRLVVTAVLYHVPLLSQRLLLLLLLLLLLSMLFADIMQRSMPLIVVGRACCVWRIRVYHTSNAFFSMRCLY
jgi:hypothetical protein